MKSKYLTLPLCSVFFLNSSTATAALGWSDWINRDGPGGTSDAETLPAILQSGLYPTLCTSPAKIEARYQSGGVWQTITPQTISAAPNAIRFFTAADGLQCYNADQNNGRPQCFDYQVRFYCDTDA